ncbi:MAG: alginate lyase family protein [Phenylobacterium sp.]|jgi:poly(beta-D-mannuronate) lyase|uniref:alginate lyase family protein n=1 Tax=Phenylobacterium sp. TaxID=1871053 RepID=UPI002A36D814|nr:alginate lyase family protein [Phenylobacterium sp.]MDX9997295.1 alginate lyase family protein [Phenylobacterium sp.]
MTDWAKFTRRTAILVGASAWLAPSIGACASSPADFRPPFPTAPPADLVKLDREVETPEPVISLSSESRYVRDDPARADVDPDAAEAYERAVAPLRAFEREVVRHANRYVRSQGRTPAHAARCGGMLWRWASAGALDEMGSDTAQFNRSATVAALSLAWMQVRDAIDPADEGRREIETWFGRRGDAVRDYYETKEARQRSARNNHRYWAGLAAAGAGVSAGSSRLLVWGLDSGALGLSQVDADGALPLELSRGKRALYYHAYALGPLLMLAELGARNGRSLYEAEGGALHRLVAFTLAGIDDPALVAEKAGGPQEPLGGDGGAFDKGDVAWLEIYDARFGGRNPWAARLSELRPLTSTRLGGDLTLLFSARPA